MGEWEEGKMINAISPPGKGICMAARARQVSKGIHFKLAVWFLWICAASIWCRFVPKILLDDTCSLVK